MPDCHSCPHDGKKDQACIECTGPCNNNNGGQTFVSADLIFNLTAPTVAPTPELNLNPCCCDAVRLMMSMLLNTNDVDRTLIFHVLCGGTPTSWAKERGVTKQSAFARVKRIVGQHPPMKSILVKVKE